MDKTGQNPLTDSDGNMTGILGIMHEITDMKLAQEELQCLYNELEVWVEARTEELLHTQQAYQRANNKLNLLNSVTRHDILNQMTALNGYLELVRESVSDPATIHFLKKAEQSARIIQGQILFTKLYQDIGVHAPVWQPLQQVTEQVFIAMKTDNLTVSLSFHAYEVYADLLLEKVFYTLIDNSQRHGQRVTMINAGDAYEGDTLIIWYEDDGIGIEPRDKDIIFERGYGNNTGLGLFLTREILSITGFSIRETGSRGVGVRFEISVPRKAFRIIPGSSRNDPYNTQDRASDSESLST